MTSLGRAVICLFCACAFTAAMSFGQTDAGELERKVDRVFAAYDKPDSPGCVVGVVRDGEFIYKKGYGTASLELGVPLTPQSVFYMGSVSKQFTAASVVLAAEQGLLSLDDDIRKYVPELPYYGKTITLRQMLHHTSGFRDILGLLLLAGRNFEDIHPTPELLDLLSRQKALNYQPGDEFLYSNTNYFLMSVVIRRAAGKPLSQFAEENIFKPLGMTHTRFYDDHSVIVPGRVPAYEPRLDGSGFRVDWSTNFDKIGDGGLMSSVDDLLLWDRNFYNNKLGKGTLLKELQTQGVLNNGKQIEYALGLFLSTYRGLPVVGHGGALFGYRTEILRFPQQKFSVITLCNVGTSDPNSLCDQVAEIYLAGQLSSDSAPAAAKVDPQPFAGWYRNLESHSVLQLSVVDGELEAFGTHFKPRDATHFFGVPATDESPEIVFNGLQNSGMRFTLNFKDTAPQTFERYEPLKASAENFAPYAGEYTSAELQATYRFAIKDGKLTLTTNWQEPAVLEPTVLDEFQGPFGTAIVFRRDRKGHVIGCDLFAGRVRNITFAKTAK